MMPMNHDLERLQRSGIRVFTNLARQTAGCRMLTIGEPDLDTPREIREAAARAMEAGQTHYAPNRGTLGLRTEIAKYLRRNFDLNYDPATEVLLTCGGAEAGNVAFMTTIDQGDEVIVFTPAFMNYENMIAEAGGVMVPIPLRAEDGFQINCDILAQHITPKTKMIVINNPCNPTGIVYSRQTLEGVAKLCVEHNILVFSDEIYNKIVYDGTECCSIATLPGMAERTVVVNGFSKTYAMTGWRLGYACGPAPIIKIMTKIHQSAIMSAPTTSQYAAITALKDCDGEIERMRNEYNMRRRLVVKSFNDMGLSCFEPRGAFYAFPCIKSSGMSSEEFCTKLLEQKHVAIIPGNAFGASGEGYARVSYAYSVEHLMEAIRRIREFLNENCK